MKVAASAATLRAMGLRWDMLRADAFEELEKGEFEHFCRELLVDERRYRHDLGSEIEGPEKTDRPDGGCDLLFLVKGTPHMASEVYQDHHGVRPLTPDAGKRAYSCKTGANWRKTANEEAKERSHRVIEILQAGGSFTLLVNQPVTRRGELVKQLAESYASRMGHGGPTGDELVERIRVIDANDLCEFLKELQPRRISERFARVLGIEETVELLDFEKWEIEHTRDRPPAPSFVRDPEREAIRERLSAVISSGHPDRYQRIVWILGPPGIGKTRLVLEALREDRFNRRVLVALGAEDGQNALLVRRVFERFPGTILVVDDCPADRADALAGYARQLEADVGAALVILTPRARHGLRTSAISEQLEVQPLLQGETEKIVREQLGSRAEPELVARLAAISEGYPWFAALVAGELDAGRPSPRSVAEAADLALASPRSEGARWEDAVIDRARALFAVMLTEDTDWAELDDKGREDLCYAVGVETYGALERARSECERRGLIRVRAGGKFKYVTPEILAREVARKLLLGGPPGGPTPLGRRLRRVPHWARALYERLEQLGMDVGELGALMEDVVAQVEEAAPGLSIFGAGGIPTAALLLAARYAPVALSAALRARVEESSMEELRARRDVRRPLVWTLETAVRCTGGFESAEAALFRLALAENEPYGNNATSEWKSLFHIGLNPTRVSWEGRVTRLRDRCRTGPPEARRLGLLGLDAALSQRVAVSRPAGVEPPSRMSVEEIKEARLDAWGLLLECLLDEDSGTAHEAQLLVAKHLRGAVREGLLDRFADDLLSRLHAFDESSLRDLHGRIEQARVGEGRSLERSRPLREAVERLAVDTAPYSFGQRLRQQLGMWDLLELTEEEEKAADERLAREGLSSPDRPILSEIGWLLSEAAVRAMHFALALGRADRERVALGHLVDRVRAGASPDVLSSYCAGMADVEPPEVIDALLTAWAAEPLLGDALVLTVVRAARDDLPPVHADLRARLVMDVVRHGRVDANALASLGWGSWSRRVPSATLQELCIVLLGQASQMAAVSVLEIVLEHLALHPDRVVFCEAMLSAMERLADDELKGVAAEVWERGGVKLIELGAVVEACRLALRGVLASERPASHDRWDLVKECERRAPDALWDAVRVVLEQRGQQPFRVAVSLAWNHVGARFPGDRVLEWVGRDRHRALLVALFVPMRSAELPQLARGLIVRFGSGSPPARQLAASMHSTYGLVSSLTDFTREQLAHVRQWSHDADPEVRAWAASMIEELERSEELYSAQEEHERRRFGT